MDVPLAPAQVRGSNLAMKKLKIGTWITAPHPSIVDLIASTSLDWVCVDLEHSPTSYLDVQQAFSIIQGHGKSAFVRVSENRQAAIKFPLDAGANGLIVPMVCSAEEARNVVDHAFYPPLGKRPVGLARAQRYGFGFDKHLTENRGLEVIVQIEHINAVRDIDKILAVEGLAGVFLGPYDLSGSMGIPGQLDHPRMKEAIRTVRDKTLSAGKVLGAHVIQPSSEKFKEYVDLGYNFLAFSIDTYFLGQKLQDELEAIHRLL
jgi:2-dehydro-3-deoxyglucarate aldolase